VAKDELLQDGKVVRVGLVVHHPSAGDKLQLLVVDERLDLLLNLQRLLRPPHGEERNLGPDELPARVDRQLLHHVAQYLPGLGGIVVVKCFDPALEINTKIVISKIKNLYGLPSTNLSKPDKTWS